MGSFTQVNGVDGESDPQCSGEEHMSNEVNGEASPRSVVEEHVSNGVNSAVGSDENCNGVNGHSASNGVDGLEASHGEFGVTGEQTSEETTRRKRVVIVGLGMVGIAFMSVIIAF